MLYDFSLFSVYCSLITFIPSKFKSNPFVLKGAISDNIIKTVIIIFPTLPFEFLGRSKEKIIEKIRVIQTVYVQSFKYFIHSPFSMPLKFLMI